MKVYPGQLINILGGRTTDGRVERLELFSLGQQQFGEPTVLAETLRAIPGTHVRRAHNRYPQLQLQETQQRLLDSEGS